MKPSDEFRALSSMIAACNQPLHTFEGREEVVSALAVSAVFDESVTVRMRPSGAVAVLASTAYVFSKWEELLSEAPPFRGGPAPESFLSRFVDDVKADVFRRFDDAMSKHRASMDVRRTLGA